MPGKTVNLDALIKREDFLTNEGPEVGESEKKSVSITDLLKGESFFSSLRKPDFQRETAAWTPSAVCEFIKSFIESELIPTVICWQSPSRLSFVIDGAHRLSAIMAWLMNDFGDGAESRVFYGGQIPLEQAKIAKRTRELVRKEVGLYQDVKSENQNPGSFPDLSKNARALAHVGIPLQWIKGSDATKAERAFFIINQSAVSIDPTELKLLNARTEPNAVAARAIVRNATGHKYWKDFRQDEIDELEKNAREIYSLLYNPPLDPPIATVELPIAGHGYGSQTLPLIFDFLNIANDIPVKDSSKEKKKLQLSDRGKPVGDDVLKILRNAKRLAQIFTGKDPSSLGLLPAIYFYSVSGRHQPTAVLAMASLVMQLKGDKRLLKFVSIRARFEEFLLSHKHYVNQITVKHGSMAKGYARLRDLFDFIIRQLLDGKTDAEIEESLAKHTTYHYLLSKERVKQTDKIKEFSRKAKQVAFLQDALEMARKCPICGARKDNKSITADHIVDKKHGGLATTDNLNYVHPFCNSSKDALRALGLPIGNDSRDGG